MNPITLFPLKTPIIREGDSVAEILYNTIISAEISIDNGDVLVIAETPVATAEGNVVKLARISPSNEAKALAEKYSMDPRFVQVILSEADEVLGGMNGVLLTIKNNILVANAGADCSNAPPDSVVLFPKDPQKSIASIKDYFEKKFNKKIAVILGDSRVAPLRRGTIGVALAVVGMEPVEDCRGRKDLFGRELQITFRAHADNLVSAAQLLLGEADEQIPAVLIKGAPIQLKDKPSEEIEISRKDCLFMNSFSRS